MPPVGMAALSQFDPESLPDLASPPTLVRGTPLNRYRKPTVSPYSGVGNIRRIPYRQGKYLAVEEGIPADVEVPALRLLPNGDPLPSRPPPCKKSSSCNACRIKPGSGRKRPPCFHQRLFDVAGFEEGTPAVLAEDHGLLGSTIDMYAGVTMGPLASDMPSDLGARLTTLGADACGLKVYSYWEQYNSWFIAEITNFNPSTRQHTLTYLDGPEEVIFQNIANPNAFR